MSQDACHFKFGKSSPVAEHEAEGEIERVYHEIRQTLRVTGVNLLFRKWAGDGLLPVIWKALRPGVETRAFERAADRLRVEAAQAALALEPLGPSLLTAVGESQAFHIGSALDLYHYINPKLLLIAAMTRQGLAKKTLQHSSPLDHDPELIERGFPPRMYAMEMEDQHPDDERLRELFEDIQKTLSLQSINSDYRTLALWPDYLAAAWARLKPIVQRPEYVRRIDSLRQLAEVLAAELPFPAKIGRETLRDAGVDSRAAGESVQSFERLLPGLILNVALCLKDWRSGEDLGRSPFPAEARTVPSGGNI